MTDRELLELAAKAAAIELAGWSNYTSAFWLGGDYINQLVPWNPLTDDGDALRLSVKLMIDLVHFYGHLRADVRDMPDTHELHNGDPYAATRRAIVRAAAEIGKEMK